MSETLSSPLALLPRDLSPWGMFLAADLVVKTVIAGLMMAALMTWVLALAKCWELRSAKRGVRAALIALREAAALTDIKNAAARDDDPLPLFQAVTRAELQRSAGLPAAGIRVRAAASLERIEAALARRVKRGTGVLATIGSTAPFVGLFGTVWGIMNSFIGISRAQTASLAAVAPGIAEALLATALGLFAAIPAVIIYNAFARSIASYHALLADLSTELLNLLGRELDRTRPT